MRLIFLNKYRQLGLSSFDDVFNYFIRTLKSSICSYDFFVNWNKVFGNIDNVRVPLSILNSLIGESDIEKELKAIIFKYPEVVSAIPLLIAVRKNKIGIRIDERIIEYDFAIKPMYSDSEIDEIILFAKKCGLLDVLRDKRILNLIDYCSGVEVGLDTNSRKNRSGTLMEDFIQKYIVQFCNVYGYVFICQATARKIKENFNIDVHPDKSDRHFDFVIKTQNKLYIIEVNFYSNAGSKLKAVAGEFKGLCEFLNSDKDIIFIWITDGAGWKDTQAPLRDAFERIDYIFNIDMLGKNILHELPR